MRHHGQFPATRLRRLRHTSPLRALVKETHLRPDNLVLPLFIRHGLGIKKPISSMPGHYQISVDQLADEVRDGVDIVRGGDADM